jgi:hypothetical protein
MALTPKQLYQLLNKDVNRVFEIFTTQYNSDTGQWIASDSGILAPTSVEAARLKTFADAHLTEHHADGRARDIWLRLKLMGKTSSSTVDTGTA